MFSLSMSWAARRYASIMTFTLEALKEKQKLWKLCDWAMRANSRADSTMPRGVSPYLFMMRSDSDP